MKTTTLRAWLVALVVLATLVSDPRAQPTPIRGFPSDAVGAEREREEQFRKVPDSARLKEYMVAMAGEPHVAGRPASRKVAEYALEKFKSWGLDARIESFDDILRLTTVRMVVMV
jgi:N-acetylated-alpha-linked acidic dipeptidase